MGGWRTGQLTSDIFDKKFTVSMECFQKAFRAKFSALKCAKAILVYEQGKTPDWFRDFEHYFVQYLIFKLPPPF
jgi:hypothetical protein